MPAKDPDSPANAPGIWIRINFERIKPVSRGLGKPNPLLSANIDITMDVNNDNASAIIISQSVGNNSQSVRLADARGSDDKSMAINRAIRHP